MTSAWPSIDSDLTRRTFAVVMAGGNGTRLGELTRWHSKPALPFGGQYRNIDFPLSNCVNSGLRRVAVATQYKAHSLIQHVSRGWSFLRPELGEGVELWPAQQRCGRRWYEGTADAIRQNLDLVETHTPEFVLVLAGDHVYKMDYRPMLYEHAATQADVTVGCVEVPLEHASEFGIMETDARGCVTRFEEKPRAARAAQPGGTTALASMGIYVFSMRSLVGCLGASGPDAAAGHDFGRDILPALIASARARVHAFAFHDPVRSAPGYWRDVGTLGSYWRANMDLLDDCPAIDLGDTAWPIRTYQTQAAPARFVGAGTAMRSIVASGCTVAGTVERAVLAPGCTVGAGARVESSVVLPDVTIGRDSVIRHAIVEAGCRIPDGFVLGAEPGGEHAFADGPVALVTAETVAQAEAELAAGRELAYASR